MPIKYIGKVRKVGTSHVISIPKPIMEGMSLKDGDRVNLIVNKEIVIKPVK